MEGKNWQPGASVADYRRKLKDATGLASETMVHWAGKSLGKLLLEEYHKILGKAPTAKSEPAGDSAGEARSLPEKSHPTGGGPILKPVQPPQAASAVSQPKTETTPSHADRSLDQAGGDTNGETGKSVTFREPVVSASEGPSSSTVDSTVESEGPSEAEPEGGPGSQDQ